MLLSIIGARKIRNGLRSGGRVDTRCILSATAAILGVARGRVERKEMRRADALSPRSAGRSVGAVAIGEGDGVFANICRPFGDQLSEPAAVIGKQCAGGFLEIGAIARNSRHEVIGGIACL